MKRLLLLAVLTVLPVSLLGQFTPVSIDPNNIDAAPGPWQHQILNSTGTTRYLCAYNAAAPFQFRIYRSTNSGATWAIIDNNTYPGSLTDNALLDTQLIVGGGSGGSDLILLTQSTPKGSPAPVIIQFSQFDVGTLTWAAITNIGGGFDQNSHEPLSATQSAGVLRFKRPDGSFIVIYQCEPITNAIGGTRRVRILKRTAGGTWSQLAVYGSSVFVGPNPQWFISDHYVLWSGIMDNVGNVHIFINHAHVPVPDGGSFYADPNGMELVHVSISANDVVSAIHHLDQDIEQMPAVTNPAQPTGSTENGRPSINDSCTEIAFGYGYQTNTFPSGTGAHVHIVRGDMSIDPLNPTWTVTDIATNEPKWNNGFSNDVSVTYDTTAKIALEWFGVNVTVGYGEQVLSGLKIYWATLDGLGNGKLRFSRLNAGIWSAPAQLWPDPNSNAVSLDGFDIFSTPTNACSAPPKVLFGPNPTVFQ